MPEPTFTNCHCPHCKRSLNDVPITTPVCLLCRNPLKPDQVWQTRRYPGLIVLPTWLLTFGGPILLILLGLVSLYWQIHYLRVIDLRLTSLIFAVGIVYFFYALISEGK